MGSFEPGTDTVNGSCGGWLRLCLVLLLALGLGACTHRIVYDNADWWLNWYIDDYVDFNREQQRQVDRYLEQHMRWHRRSELPRYEAFLRQVKQDVSAELTAGQVRARFEDVYRFWRDFVSAAMPACTTMFAQLSDRQVSDFLASIDREARRYDKQYGHMTPAERARDHQKDAERSLKKWIGKLTDEQRGIISRWARAMHNVYPASVAQRQQWRQALELALRERNDTTLLAQRLHELFVSPSDAWQPQYRELMEANELLTAQLVADIHRTLSDKQRKHLLTTLAGYLEDLRQLQRSRGGK